MRFAKKMGQIAQFWPPEWLIHRRSPPPTRQSMQRPNEQQQRLSSWAINYHILKFDMWLRNGLCEKDQNNLFPGISEHAGPKGQKRFTSGGPLASGNFYQHFCLKQPSIY